MKQAIELLSFELNNLEAYIMRSENSGVHRPSQEEYEYRDELHDAIEALECKAF